MDRALESAKESAEEWAEESGEQYVVILLRGQYEIVKKSENVDTDARVVYETGEGR